MLYAFDDRKGWGRRFAGAARAEGFQSVLVADADSVPAGERCFVRLDQQGEELERTKGVALELHERGCIVTPSLDEIRWYDDKIAQGEVLREWMPETRIFTRLEDALAFAAEAEYPLISKASCGASSANVRILRSREEAEAEAQLAFGPGLVCNYGRAQKGYVYWQKFVQKQAEYRVTIIGDYLFGHERFDRPEIPLASGSRNYRPLTFDGGQERDVAGFVSMIARTIGTDWMAFDILADSGGLLVLEMSCSFGYAPASVDPVFRADAFDPLGCVAGEIIMQIAARRLAEMGGCAQTRS